LVRIMAKFKMIVSDPQTRKATVAELEGAKAQVLIGRSIGEVIDGSQIGFSGSKLKITGGCDKDGIPMRADVHGGGKKYVVLSGGVGFRPTRSGERRRKLVRGQMITDETYQVNTMLFTGKVEPEERPPPVKEPELKPAPTPAKRPEAKARKPKPAKKPPKKPKKKK
jgi:small subunit ribosomal protein S6e